MSLKELPIRPTPITANVKEGYVKELEAVTTPEQLWEFAKRWRPLYLLTRKPKINKKAKDAKRFRVSQNNMQNLISGAWDPKEALECVQVGRTGICKHARQYSCPGMHILVPEVLLLADAIGEKYGVTSDLALIQMGGGLEKLEG